MPVATAIKTEFEMQGGAVDLSFSQSKSKRRCSKCETVISAAKKRSEIVTSVRQNGGRAVSEGPTCREALMWRIHGMHWQAIILLAALVDITVLFVEMGGTTGVGVDTLTIIVLLLFTVDIILRLYTYQLLFFRRLWNYIDTIVLVTSVILFLIGLSVQEDEEEAALNLTIIQVDIASSAIAVTRGSRALRGLITAIRIMRALRVARTLVNAGTESQRAARHMTGENKKRFIDLKHNLDLDLVYITPGLVAMSVPATGIFALYRNPLTEVARFFETRHHEHGYTIFNCCPELPYPTTRFTSGTVKRFDIQDHTPPTMNQFSEFLNMVRELPENRLVVVHCRGGKGRTGSLCCAWLLYTRTCEDADDALNMFALERTELKLGKKKLQGVDTPSQRRYVQCVHALLSKHNSYLGARLGGPQPLPPAPVPLAPRCTVLLESLSLFWWYLKPPTEPLVCAIHVEAEDRPGGSVIYWSAPLYPPFEQSSFERSVRAASKPDKTPKNVDEVLQADTQEPIIFELGGVEVQGDVRISVFSLQDLMKAREKNVKKGRPARLDFDAAPIGPWGDETDAADKQASEDLEAGSRPSADNTSPVSSDTSAPQSSRASSKFTVFNVPEQQGAEPVELEMQQSTRIPSRAEIGSFPPTKMRKSESRLSSRHFGQSPKLPWKSVKKILSRHKVDRTKLVRVIAGKEAGCKFYFLFHTGFVGDGGVLDIPVHMMDKAFKSIGGQYHPRGFARMSYTAPMYDGYEIPPEPHDAIDVV